MTYPVPLRRRTPGEAVRYVADKLMTGTDPEVVGLTLLTLAGELEGVTWPEPLPATGWHACGAACKRLADGRMCSTANWPEPVTPPPDPV